MVGSGEASSMAFAVASPMLGMTWEYVSRVVAIVAWTRSSWTNFGWTCTRRYMPSASSSFPKLSRDHRYRLDDSVEHIGVADLRLSGTPVRSP